MARNYVYNSPRSHLIGKILWIILGIFLYIAIGAAGTIGIAILLLWIVNNYKYEACDNVYELYDIVNKKHITYIKTKRDLRKGEIICCARKGDWYIEEIDACFVPLYAYTDGEKDISTHDEEQTFCLLKCRKIYDLYPEKLFKKEQLEKFTEE